MHIKNNVHQEYVFTKGNFPEIRSAPNWFRTWLVRSAFAIALILIIVLFYAIPFLFHMDGTINGKGLVIFLVLYYPFIISMTYLARRYFRRFRGNAVRHITVNREGVFYEKLDGRVEALRYRDLSRSHTTAFDVFSRKISRYGPIVLRVVVKGTEQTVYFENTDAAYSYYSGNSRLLRSLFIQGIKLFRPDLRIAKWVYSDFFIHPETYEFDKKNYWKTIVAVIIFIMLILLGIEWHMRQRFGLSLFFE